MARRAMATRRRPVQARRVRRLEMDRPNIVAVINEGAAWTALNAQRVPGLALAVAALVLLAYLFGSPSFFVYGAEVTGAGLVPAEQVYQASGADMSSIFFLSTSEIEAKLLEALPALQQVKVSLGLPAELHIRVVEKRVRFVWEVAGQAYLADEKGVIVGTGAAAPDAVRIRVSEGAAPATGQVLDAAVLQTAWGLSELLPGARSFEYSPRQGIGWRSEQGWPVYFGLGGDLAQKVAVMRALAADLARQGVKPQFLDVSVPGRPFYR